MPTSSVDQGNPVVAHASGSYVVLRHADIGRISKVMINKLIDWLRVTRRHAGTAFTRNPHERKFG
jgi:hypothetical protein